MAAYACSLHPLDVRLLKMYVGAVLGGTIPDLTEEAARRRQRDMVYTWSQRVARAAAPLAGLVGPEAWHLYTKMRPFFVTADTPDAAVMQLERLLESRSLDEVVNYFREEVARLDPDRADEIIDIAIADDTPPSLEVPPLDDVERRMRAYLLYERRQLEPLAAASLSSMSPETLHAAGRWLSWRACVFMANVHPWWSLPNASLTSLARRPQYGLATAVADPRGAFAAIAQRIPGIHEHLPYFLTEGSAQTGVCIPPKNAAAAAQAVADWPDTMVMPSPQEKMAISEALLYVSTRHFGLWEISGLVDPDRRRIGVIQADQGDREEHPERYPDIVETPEPTSSTFTLAEDNEPDYRRIEDEPEYEARLRATLPNEDDTKAGWWQRLGKK